MISAQEALKTVLNSAQDFGVEEIPFLNSVGSILKEEIFADRDFPPFNRVSMDGIVIDYTSFKNGQRAFKIEGIQAAGSEQITLLNTKNCIEVMTGAVLPNNANTVIRYEDIRIDNGFATITIDTINKGQNIHTKGKDGKAGALLIQINTIISAAEIGVLASVGKSVVKVAKQPKVMIVSTGDELVGVAETPLAHQIRRSNVFTLVSLLERLHIPSETAVSDGMCNLSNKETRVNTLLLLIWCAKGVSATPTNSSPVETIITFGCFATFTTDLPTEAKTPISAADIIVFI